MARILIVYYSRTGTTKRAAIEISKALGADLEEISDRTARRGMVGYLRSVMEATLQRVIDIDPAVHELGRYDLVVFGSPTWVGSVPSPVRTFIRQHRESLKAAALFCTCAGRGGERVLRQMTRECGKDPAAVLVLREVDVSRGSAGPAIHRFVAVIRETLETDHGARQGAGQVSGAAA